MTTGSWDGSNTPARRVSTLSWTGDDRPKRQWPKRKYVTVERDGVKYRYLSARIGVDRPTKRELDVPHSYRKDWNHLFSGDVQTYTNNFGNPTANAVALNVGFAGVTGFITPVFSDNKDPGSFNAIVGESARMIAQLREKLFGSDFNASVFLGESVQTLDLIGDSAKRISTSLRRLRRGDFHGAAKSLVDGTSQAHLLRKRDPRLNSRSKAADSLSNDWLQLQYGWLPLIKDTHDAAHSLAHAINAPFQRWYTVSKKRERVEWQSGGGSSPIDATYSYGFRNVSSRKFSVLVKERPSTFYALGLMNPEIVAWELMPWSFAIDWFLPIGQYLEARAAASCIVGDSWLVYERSKGDLIDIRGHLLRGGAYYKRGYFLREVRSSPPAVPLPSFVGIDKALSWKRCVNTLALLNGLGTKLRPREVTPERVRTSGDVSSLLG